MTDTQGIETQSVAMSARGLNLPLGEGRQGSYNHYWLRDNCPTSFDSQTRERTFDIFHLADGPQPAVTRLDEDALEIVWQGDGHRSRYPLDLLRRYSEGKRRADPADLPRRAWYGDHYPSVARFAQPELLAGKPLVADWLRALLVEGVAIVTDMPDSDGGLTDLVKLMGHVRPTFFGEYFDVRTHIKPTNLAYTAKALEMHILRHVRDRPVPASAALYRDPVQ